ncbi:hypothetical protein L345_12631, partial [Ophiophagus hannah]
EGKEGRGLEEGKEEGEEGGKRKVI